MTYNVFGGTLSLTQPTIAQLQQSAADNARAFTAASLVTSR